MPDKCFRGASPNFDHFFHDFRTRHHVSAEHNVTSTNKKQVSIYNVSLKSYLLSVTFDPETAEIRWLMVTHHMKIQHFFVIAMLPT